MDERKKVLELVAAGQLTIDEGDRLIEALDAAAAAPAEVVSTGIPGRGIYESVVRAVESATGVGSMKGWLSGAPSRRRGTRVDEIVSFASNGIDADFVREMREIFDEEIDPGMIVAFAAHGVEADFVREIWESFDQEIDPGEIVAFASHGVDVDFVREMRDIFDHEIDAGEIIALASHGVDADFVREMVDSGLASAGDVLRRKSGTPDA